jgi:hypothetical protein
VADVRGWIDEGAALVALAGFVPYVLSIVRRQTVPQRATWIIWTVVGAVLCASYYADGARDTIWVPIGYVIGPLVTALLALRYGVGGWTRSDRACLAASGASLLLWLASGSATIALLANIAVDASGALPTIAKTYRDPRSESGLAWSIFLVADSLNLLALGSWTLEAALYPVYLFGVALAMVALIGRGNLALVGHARGY